MLKKIISLLIVLLIACVPALASDNISASFDITDFSVTVRGTADGLGSSGVSVTVTDNDDPVSPDNLPVYSYLHKVGDDKKIDIKLLVSKKIGSGKVYVYLDAPNYHDSTSLFVFNPEDTATIEACADADAITDKSEFYNFVVSNADVLGIDTDNSYISDNLTDIAEALFYEKETVNASDPEEFYDCSTKCLAYVMIKNGTDIGTVVDLYAYALGISVDEYTAMNDAVRSNYEKLLMKSDNKTNSIPDILSDSLILAHVISAGSWSELEEVLRDYDDRVDIDMSASSDFADIPAKKQYKVFVELYDNMDDITDLQALVDMFDEATESVLDSVKETKPSSGGGGFSGGSSSGGTSVYVPDSYTDNIPVAPVVTPTAAFSDISGHYAEDTIAQMAAEGIINGYEDGTFRPDGFVTRAEFAAMLAGALGLSAEGKNTFSDVSANDWYYDCIEAMAYHSYISGYNGYFTPRNNITRQDAAVILSNILSGYGFADSDVVAEYVDYDLVADYAKKAVDNVSANGIMKGDASGFRPASLITRAEAAVTVSRILSLIDNGEVAS